MQLFKISKSLEVQAETYETRYSWGHKAWLFRNSQEIDYKKITYSNRTWEAYEFESILESLARSKELTEKEKKQFEKKIKNQFQKEDPAMKKLGQLAGLAKLAAIMQPERSADASLGVLAAGLGDALIIPEDWQGLPDEEKQRRMDGALGSLIN